jgi:hypothetical protein
MRKLNIIKIRKNIFICITSLFCLSCSSSSENSDPVGSNPQAVEKDLVKMTGTDDHWLHYENGKIDKAWASGTTVRSQMVYNPNGTMSREYFEGTGNPSSDNQNFGWEIPVSNHYMENVYENEKLVSVIEHNSGNSWKRVEYTYQGDLVVEKRAYYTDDNLVDRYFRYIYNSKNEIITIIWDESPSGGSSHTLQVTFDDKVNPYYKIWKETKLTFWNAQDGPARHNLEFYPHNVLNLLEGANDIWYSAYYTYDKDNLPITMHIDKGVQQGTDNYFEYN